MCIQCVLGGAFVMDGKIGDAEFYATNATPEIGSDSGFAPACESDPDEWFYEAARDLLGVKDTGQLLHITSGHPLSSCYAYTTENAAKRRRPPDHLVRQLIHSDHGEPWHRAYMAGCRAKWWTERESERRLAELASSIFAQLQNVMGAGNGAERSRR